MKCSQVEAVLSAYHDGELAKDVHSSVTEHLENCDACRQTLQRMGQLSLLAKDLDHPAPSEDLWGRIESELDGDSEPLPVVPPQVGHVSLPQRWSSRSYLTAAIMAVLLGIGAFWSYQAPTSHVHSQFQVVLREYVDRFLQNPPAAQEFLLSTYQHVAVQPDKAAEQLGYRPAVAAGLPPELRLESMQVIKMPCCKCVQCTCSRADGSRLAIFEHEETEMKWFPHEPAVAVSCHSTTCVLTQLNADGALAASWELGKRRMTLIGARGLTEIDELVAWFDDQSRSVVQ